MKTSTLGYAKHPGGRAAAVGASLNEVKDFGKTALGMNWYPTVVNPAMTGGREQLLLFWFHLIVWVVALVLSSTANLGTFAGTFMGNGTNSSGYLDPDYGYGEGVASGTKTIGLFGGISTIIGVLFLLFAASYYDALEYRDAIWINIFVHLLTLYGTVASFYIFCTAAADTDEAVFYISCIGALFMLYAQVLLYCTSATLEGGVKGLPRAFVPCFALSLQIVSYIAIAGGDFKCYDHSGASSVGVECTSAQKALSLFVPLLCLLAIFMMGVIRFLVYAGLDTTVVKRPFLRSLIIMPYLASGLLSVYKIAITVHWSNPVAFMFTFTGMLLQFGIIGIVFVPDAALYGEEMGLGK
jgi:hypothetical protein